MDNVGDFPRKIVSLHQTNTLRIIMGYIYQIYLKPSVKGDRVVGKND